MREHSGQSNKRKLGERLLSLTRRPC